VWQGEKVAELDDAVHERIRSLCGEGDTLAKTWKCPAALQKYWAAWDLLPEPKTDRKAATWILAAIGNANYLGFTNVGIIEDRNLDRDLGCGQRSTPFCQPDDAEISTAKLAQKRVGPNLFVGTKHNAVHS
jgi:hypothetical protein